MGGARAYGCIEAHVYRSIEGRTAMRTVTSLLLLLVLAAPAVAQEREIRDANLPRAMESRLLRMYEGAATRYEGERTIAAGDVVEGDIAAVTGPLRIAGRVDGDVAMVGGDVILEPGGEVLGSITVVGGQVRMADDAVVGGSITAYGAPSDEWRRTARDRDRQDDGGRRDRWWDRDEDRRRGDGGYSRLTVRAGTSYNRVEGLPVLFGPVVETAGRNPLRVEALAIWRTESGASLDTERMGYRVLAEQYMGGRRAFSVGGTVHSMVDPMDRWQLSDLEASLAAVLFHHDYRDHFDRSGWSAFLRVRPLPWLDARVTYRDERHGALAAADPWSLFNRSDSWRLQPMVAEGTLRTLGASAQLDRRDRRDEPRLGWLARASVERPVGGALAMPELTGVPATPVSTSFTTGFADVRRYAPVGDNAGLAMRVVGGGSLGGEALPPQFQHALGGPGTLPGFPLFHGDCGARRIPVQRGEDAFFPAYGCDRFALGQIEYRGNLSFGLGFGFPRDDRRRDWWDDIRIDARPTWVIFVDAGRGWAASERIADDTGSHTDTLVDAGLGVLIGKLGLYAALPLNGDVDQSPRFMLRWGPRF
jgi:hypothetical protein